MSKTLPSADREPAADSVRHDALRAGGSDPLNLRFRVVEYERASGQFVRVLLENSGFHEALENTRAMIPRCVGSHFCLEPVGFVQ